MATNYPAFDGYNKLNPSTAQAGVNPDDYNKYLTDEELVVKYKNLIQTALNDTSTWRDKQDQWYKQRMRVKKKKVFPYEGCSNLKMPTDERHIRKKKAKHANRIFGIRPIVQAVPPPGGDPGIAMRIEKFLDHLIMDVMGFYNRGVIAIDKMLESGFSFMKPYWRIDISKRSETFGLDDMTVEEAAMVFSHGTDPDFIKQEIIKRLDIDMDEMVADENERAIEDAIVKIYQGADDVTIEVQDIIYNAPDVATPDTSRIIAPAESPLNPQDSEWICHDLILPFRVFLSRSERGYKNIDEVNGLLSKSLDPNFPLEQSKNFREGINRYHRAGQIRLWEIYAWEKLNPEDSAPRKCVITIAPEFNIVNRRISLDALDGKFPLARLNNEIIDDRWYSPRGVPEIITDIVKEIDVQKNQRIDSQTTRNAPIYMYRVGIVNPNIKIRPNKGIPVPAGVPFDEAFRMINNTNLNAEFSYKDELQQLNAETEELLGEINFTLQSQINKRQPRTGTEVEAQMQNMMPSANLEGDMVAEGFSELFQMILALWCQYGPDAYEFQYFGPNAQGKFETIKLTKEQLEGHIITVRGNDSNTNPSTRIQKAMTIKQMVSDPLSLQMGITTPVNVYNANRQAFQELGVNPDLYVSPPQPPGPPPLPKINLGMEDLTPAEAMQVKSRMGINPDIKGNLEMGIRDHQKHRLELSQGSAEVVGQALANEAAQINNQSMRQDIGESIPAATTK